MEYAIDKVSGFLIDARQALPLKRKYLCPKCYADCHLRTGKNRRPHFVHDSGKASDDCENYHPSETIISNFHSIGWSDRRRLPSIYVCLSDSILYDAKSWTVQLLVPECPTGTGNVVISDGEYGSVTIPIERLNKGGRRVYVLPKTTYQIRVNGLVDSTYCDLFGKPIVGLDKHCCNVFHFSSTGGRKLEEKQSLFWGQSYYVVWHRDFEPPWWPRKDVVTLKNLPPNRDWQCTIIKLSTTEDYQVKKWVEKVLRREIKIAPGTLSVITPIVIRRLDDGSLQLPSDSETLVSLTAKHSGKRVSKMCMQLPDGSINMLTIPTFERTTIVSIGKLPIGRSVVWFPENPDIGISLFAVKEEIDSFPQGVMLSFEQAKGKSVIAPVHSILAKTYVQALEQGSLSLAGVSVPWGVQAKVRYKDNSKVRTALHEKTLFAEQADNEEENILRHKEFEESLCQIIQGAKTMTYEMFEVDFGNYGKIKILPSLSSPEVYKLSHQVRRQLQWVVSLLNATNQKSTLSSGEGVKKLGTWMRQVPLQQFALEDRIILSRLLKYTFIPISVETSLRNIVKLISKECSQNTRS